MDPRKHPQQDPLPRPRTPSVSHYCLFQNHGTNPNPNPNPYCILSVEVHPNGITGVKWLKMSNNVTIGGLPWQWPRTAADGGGNCCGWTSAKTAITIAAELRGLPWLVRRSFPRTEPRHVPWPQPWHLPWKCRKPWHLPWKPADFHCSPWQHPRKSTEFPRSLPPAGFRRK